MKAIATSFIGIGIALLGLLWLLQGADVLHVRPLLCVADCEPVVGGSTTWLVTGGVAMLAGIIVIRRGIRLRRRP
jgi:hypothetical protein